jgi:hypothetical protein
VPRISSQRLGRRDHLDQPAVFQHQRIAAAQRDRVFQVEQEFEPARARHRHPPPVPVVEIEHDGIGRRLPSSDAGPQPAWRGSCCLTRFLHANRFPLRLKTLTASPPCRR